MIKKTLLLIFFTGLLFANDTNKFNEGKQVFDKWCIHCHGVGMPATDALSIVYKDTEISPVLEERKNLDKSFIEYVVRNGRFSMPFFRKIEINNKQLESLSFYLSTKNR